MAHQDPQTPDPEKGDPVQELKRQTTAATVNYNGLGEYEKLKRFIETGDQDRINASEDRADEFENIPRWMFWEKEKTSPGELTVPGEWLTTGLSRGFRGLTEEQVQERRAKFGFNEIVTEKQNVLITVLSYFSGPILYVMWLAAILAAGLRDWIDFGVILGILSLNAFVGWYQEKQAHDVVESLKGDIALRAQVLRYKEAEQDEGQGHPPRLSHTSHPTEPGLILAREIVPGDIIVIEEGQTVPCDARLICDFERPQDLGIYLERNGQNMFQDAKSLAELSSSQGTEGEDAVPESEYPLIAVDQSAINGESLAQDKYMGDVIYYTTGCKRGKAYAVALCSAKQSMVGRTAMLVQAAEDQGHFKQIMNSIGTVLLVLVAFFILASWAGGFYHHIEVATAEHHSVSLLHYALIFMIIGVPVGLPVVTTTTLAVGASFLAKKKAIVQKLTAIESLAGVDVLCSDKTGTLTANKLSIREPFLAPGQDADWMMACAALASSHNVERLDPIDKVTLLTLKRYPNAMEILDAGWKTEKFTPFDPVSKMITAIVTLGDDKFTCAKGAPNAILRLSNCDAETKELFNNKAKEFASRGFRTLGVAYKRNDDDWTLLGLISMLDPPREDTAQTIIEAQQLGLSVKMLTGDAVAIAKETCKMLALGTKVYNPEKLVNGGLSGEALHDLVERADGFAEVHPDHKYKVVELLQERGHLTAMTGDGVNDAPSLKKSDCGIAVEGSTEAAQAAADIIFLSPGLRTIVTAIKTSREIFQRMKAYIEYRIALCLHLELYLVLTMLLLKETIPSELIVFVALFADLATVAVAYDNAHSEPRPVEWQLPKIWIVSILVGILLAAATWTIRGALFLSHGGIIQSYGDKDLILFLEIVLTENWLIFVTRGSKTWPSWKLVAAVLVVDVIATLFCAFGWFSHGRTDIVTVCVVWAYSVIATIVIAMVYFLLNGIPWLNDLGRQNRSKEPKNAARLMAAAKCFIAAFQDFEAEQTVDGSGRRTMILKKRGDEEDD